ncbi:Protein CBG22730 [Caenorhabditis briggsae]|uniref:Protein transport protein sec16 n=1 Tax=Caenorhabditis briggsae TaxID=6238 RepID=A8Y317_CAEBR|nr:Protein CBG22730 [Caenorhabditis briggsae]CAP39254.2 Protein CBG22730 [Caenorhabditis briggsae]
MTSRISQATVFSFLIYSQFSQALSKISIGLRPYQYQYVDSDFNQKYIYEPESLRPTPIPKEEILKEEDIPAFKTLDFLNMPSELEGSASAFRTMNIENTATIIPADVKPIVPKPKKRKTKRKPKRKPKKMHLRRVFKTRLITTTPRPILIEENRIDEDGIETTTNVINLAPIFDADTGTSYTPAELDKICQETVHVSKGFGISDIESFAKNNCFLIRLYYPSVTCSQINQLVGYCRENGLINVGSMSFYWQQGLQQQQDTGQAANQQSQQSHWDFINLGGAPAPQHQWNSQAQQPQQQHQQPQTNYYYQQTPHQQQQPTNHNTNVIGWQKHHFSYDTTLTIHFSVPQHPAPIPQPQQTQQIQHQPQLPKKKTQQVVIEHTPLLPPVQNHASPAAPNFTPAPPVLTPAFHQVDSQQQQQYYQQQVLQQVHQQHQQYANSTPGANWDQGYSQQPAAVQSTPQFQPPPVPQLGSAPPSMEVTPEPQHKPAPAPQMAPPPTAKPTPVPIPPVLIPPSVVQMNPAPAAPKPPVVKKEEHLVITAPVTAEEPKTKVTPTSSEDDWEKADMEIQRVDDENKRQKTAQSVEKPGESRESSSLGGSWSQQGSQPSERSSVEPVEIVEHPVVEDGEQKTPRVSMSDTHEVPTTIVHTAMPAFEDREETPEAGHRNQNYSVTIDSSSSPLEAIATSTPKDKLEKRSSVSSQGTIGADRNRSSKNSKMSDNQRHDQDSYKNVNDFAEREDASGNNSDSTMASGRPEFVRGEARASYREYKKTYNAIVDRLNFMRSNTTHSDYRPSSRNANPLLAAAGIRQHPAIRRESLGGRNDGRASVPLHHSQSFNENMYHENGGRRSRVSRLDPNGRPSSRHGPGYASVNHMDPRNHYDQRAYMQQQYRHGRHSAMAGAQVSRRPPSINGSEQYGYGHPGVGYGQEPQETSSISESEEDDENGESDDEVRGYNMQQHRAHRGQQFLPQQSSEDDGQTLYYCGVVHVNMESWRRIIEKHGVPPEFYNLNPIEKAAFMFYTVVFKQPYKNVDAFHNRFNREFYKYMCANLSNDDALYKICHSMQQQYLERQKQKVQAYESMKATMFSDETSIDGQSEINSVYEESLSNYDVHNNGPLKFTCPHSFLHISNGGQMISIQPDQSISAVIFDDIGSAMKDIATLQIKDAAQQFKGPLVPNQSAPHTVRLYITKQIENIRASAVAIENPEAYDVVESVLVWQLLEMMVKQQGNITGPDIAELLAKVARQPVNVQAPPQLSNITPALNQFTQFLLGGHIDEAVESALRNGLFADALVLTRRLFPNDERKIEAIESRFLQTRSMDNPVTTLVSVAKGEVPPVLINPPLDDHRWSWRTHAAIILANLDQRGTALSTIHQLGRALAKREYDSAADFCFLVCGVLGGDKENPFTPVPTPEGEEEYRRYISLVNSDIPDNEANPKCQYGFALTHLHATEIFDYAMRLKPDRESLLATSVEYQTARIKYAKLLASHGFVTDAYRYCTEIARAIWFHVTTFNPEDLLELCDLADSLLHRADVNPNETQWIYDLRSSIETGFVPQTVKQESKHSSQDYSRNQPETIYEQPVEPSLPTPIPVPELEFIPSAFTAPIQQKPTEHIQPAEHHEEVPSTPAGSIYQEQYSTQAETPFSFQATMEQFNPADGFTTPPDDGFSDGPLTMASSPPVPEMTPEQSWSSVADPVNAQNHIPQQSQQQPEPDLKTEQEGSNQSQGWFKSIQTKVQKATGKNPMNLPEDTNPTIVWDPAQNKYVGAGVESEPVAAPPPTVAAVPTAPVAGGGLRAARGASRYAKAGLASSSSQPPAGMMAPAPPTASFGFMPAPVDDDGDAVDPFSGQANPTIQQYVQKPSND